jgi:hypothetical protein
MGVITARPPTAVNKEYREIIEPDHIIRTADVVRLNSEP